LFEKEQIDENFSKKKGSLANQYNVQDNKNFVNKFLIYKENNLILGKK